MMKDDKTYTWTSQGTRIVCCESTTSNCNVSKLWEAAELTAFHDAELQQATKEINAILGEVTKSNKEPKRELSFIQVKGRHFLAWTMPDAVGPNNDDQTIRKTLKLKAR